MQYVFHKALNRDNSKHGCRICFPSIALHDFHEPLMFTSVSLPTRDCCCWLLMMSFMDDDDGRLSERKSIEKSFIESSVDDVDNVVQFVNRLVTD